MTSGSRHHSFLLRLWKAGNGNAPEWRMSIEDTRTRQRQGFADLTDLLAYLEERMKPATTHDLLSGDDQPNE